MGDKPANIHVATLLSSDDSGRYTRGVCSYTGLTTPCVIISPYGLLYNPPPNSMGVTLPQGGRESGIMLMVDDPNNRPLKNLLPGEVAIANYGTSDFVHIKNDNSIEINSGGTTIVVANGQVTINAATTTINGDVQVNGDITATGTVTGETEVVGKTNKLSAHSHFGSPTAPSGPVSPTGMPVPGT